MKVMIGEIEFDALTTVANASRFLAGDISRATVWALKQADAQGRGVVSATRMMLTLPWCATPPDPAALEQPAVLQEVAAMLACDLIAKPKLFADASGNSNIKSAKAGSAQVEFFAAVEGGSPIPSALWRMLVAAGLICPPGADDDGTNAGAYVSGASDGCRPYDGRYADYCRDGWLAEDRD
jgi:hypothetical protein